MDTFVEPVHGELAGPSDNGRAITEHRQVPAPAHASSLFALIARAASDPAVDMDKFERLLAMQEKQEQAQEKREFNAALARAKGKFAPILKRRQVDFATAKGRTHYKHEDLAEIANAVDVPLADEGVLYRFRSEQLGKGGDADPRRVRVTCILSRGGYSEETALEGFEDHSGNKNTHQAVASAATYLQRATLKLALGLAAGVDDDTQPAPRSKEPTAPALSEDKAAELRGLIMEACEPSKIASYTDSMLRYYGVSNIEALTPDKFEKAVKAVKKKIADDKAAAAGEEGRAA